MCLIFHGLTRMRAQLAVAVLLLVAAAAAQRLRLAGARLPRRAVACARHARSPMAAVSVGTGE